MRSDLLVFGYRYMGEMSREEKERCRESAARMSWEDKLTDFLLTDKLKIKETIGSLWLTPVVLAVVAFLQIMTMFPVNPPLLVASIKGFFLFCFTEQNKHVVSVVSVALSVPPPSAMTRNSISFKLCLYWKNSALCLFAKLSSRCPAKSTLCKLQRSDW